MNLEPKLAEPRLIKHWLQEAEDHLKSFGTSPKLPIKTIPSFNQLLWGLHPGELHVVAARTSVGKSAFSGQLSTDLAEQGKSVVAFHIEMTIKEIMRRSFSYRMDIDSGDLLRGAFMAKEFVREKWEQFKRVIVKKEFYLSEKYGREWPEILQKLDELKTVPDIVVIDNLNNIRKDGGNARGSIDEYVENFKTLCKERNIAGVINCQISRKGAETDMDMPTVSHLKESGGIEELADVVIILHWPFKAGKKCNLDGVVVEGKTYYPTEVNWKNFYIVGIEKNRNGSCHRLPLWFDAPFYKFKDWPEDLVGPVGAAIRPKGRDAQVAWES